MEMTRRERLMATLRGEPVDRPAVSFYEIGGMRIDPADPDPFNVYHDPSWRPLLELAEEETDLIRMRSAVRARSHEAWDASGSSAAAEVRRELMATETEEKDVFALLGHFPALNTTYSISREHKKPFEIHEDRLFIKGIDSDSVSHPCGRLSTLSDAGGLERGRTKRERCHLSR